MLFLAYQAKIGVLASTPSPPRGGVAQESRKTPPKQEVETKLRERHESEYTPAARGVWVHGYPYTTTELGGMSGRFSM